MSCRNRIEQDPCEPINTGLIAEETGNYKYTLKWNNIVLKGNVDVIEDAPIIITCTLNENAHTLLSVYAPNGDLVGQFDVYTSYTLNCHGS